MSRPPSLVCQHLEHISRALLEQRQAIVRRHVQGRHGVYALYRGHRLYYVGLATDLRTRLTQHLRDAHAKSWDRFSLYLTTGGNHLRELESLVLRIVMPSGNKQRGKFARSEDLRRSLMRSLREDHRAEVEALFNLRGALSTDKVPRRSAGPTRVLELARYISGPMRLRARYKGQWKRALVRRDGTIRWSGKVFLTPSGAARAVVQRPCSGWDFWECERTPGYWVRLSELRR